MSKKRQKKIINEIIEKVETIGSLEKDCMFQKNDEDVIEMLNDNIITENTLSIWKPKITLQMYRELKICQWVANLMQTITNFNLVLIIWIRN